MNVDEVAFKKRHRYITVISDRDGRALALTDDRGTESLAGYLRTLSLMGSCWLSKRSQWT
ncbi:Transposase (plasmid) [Klebsiella quasipneumoniae]|nr:Transposase [Klebsiella quasipneumoniae]